jgi:hypothetical protein
MAFSTTPEEEDTMYKRTFKVLLAASVVALAIPVTAAASPTDHSGGSVVVSQKSAPVVSEKVAGLNLQGQSVAPTATERMTKLRLALSKAPAPSVAAAEGVVVSSDTGFHWGDAGIGAAVLCGSILALVAAAGMVRRHHGHFAH